MGGLSPEAPVISVIIPLYNAEAYLPACIASVRACPENALECILVNDGSTDASRDICAAAVAEDGRFRLLDKENSGVSDSRNAGIAAARGEYVFFLDADDYIDAAHWPRILAYARESPADLVAFSYYSLFPKGQRQEERFHIEGGASADPADTYLALMASPMLNTCWGKLMRRSVITAHDLRFDPALITCEDAVFVIDFIEHAQGLLLCNQCVLVYRIHDSSIMRRRSLEGKLEDFAVLYARRAAFCAAHPEPGLCPALHREGFSVLTNLLLEYAAGHGPRAVRAACGAVLARPVAAQILAGIDPGTISPLYKRLEYAWMRRGLMLPLAFYFIMKSRFR